MTTITIDIPADLLQVLETHPEIDWKTIAQKSLLDYARKVLLADKLTGESQFNQETVSLLDEQIKSKIARHYQ
jgi:hypothetical protein